jgi:hypothetical protein
VSAAAVDDDDDDGGRNYINVNLSELVILFMIRSVKYPHAYRDYSDNKGSNVFDLLFTNYTVSSQNTPAFMAAYVAYVHL